MENIKCNHTWKQHPNYPTIRHCSKCGNLHPDDVPYPSVIPEEQSDEEEFSED